MVPGGGFRLVDEVCSSRRSLFCTDAIGWLSPAPKSENRATHGPVSGAGAAVVSKPGRANARPNQRFLAQELGQVAALPAASIRLRSRATGFQESLRVFG